MAEEITPEVVQEERELGTKPIGPLFVKYALTSLAGMIAQIIMVVLEGMVMGRGLGAHGLACVSIIISVELINLAVGGALGIGVSAVVGAKLGAGDHDGAQRTFGKGFWLTLYVSVALMLLIELFAGPLVTILGATPDIYADALIGVRIFVVFFPLTIVGQMLCAVLRVDEKPRVAAGLQIASAIIAISFLACSTFIMQWGVAGAGIYFGLTIAVWAGAFFWFVGEGKGKASLKIRMQDRGVDPALAREFVKIGFPYFCLQAASSIYTAVVNNRLAALGNSMDLAVFAIINGYVIYVLMLFVMALGFASQAIALFNNGARNWGRLIELMRIQLIYEIVFMGACSAMVCLFPEAFCSLFAAGDAELLAAAAPAVRIVVALCALGYTGSVMSSYFECVERIGEAIVCGIALYVIFTIPLVFALGALMGVDGVWWAQLVANIGAGALSIVLAIREVRRLRILATSESEEG